MKTVKFSLVITSKTDYLTQIIINIPFDYVSQCGKRPPYTAEMLALEDR